MSYIEFDQGSVWKVHVKSSDQQTSLKTRSSYPDRQNYWVPIQNCEVEIPVKKRSVSSSIKRNQFPLTLAWASTVHKVWCLSLEQGVIDLKANII